MKKNLNSFIFDSDLKNALKLIQDGMDINTKYGVGIRPIISAINSDEPKTLEFVIEHGANVNIDSGEPLKEAIDICIQGMIQDNRNEPYPESLEILKILLNNGADLELENEKGERPIDIILAYAQNGRYLERLKSFFRPLIPNIDAIINPSKSKK